VDQAEDLKAALLKAFETSSRVLVDLGPASSMSVACLQLLVSAHRWALTRGCRLILMDRRPDFIDQYILEAGFIRDPEPGLEDGLEALWAEGGDL
jgi:anti-anti-sigma regulatory factor